MTHAGEINQRIRAAGMVWHDCDGCGRPWPFPEGPHADREWKCHACVQAYAGRVGACILQIDRMVRILRDSVEAAAEEYRDLQPLLAALEDKL